LALAGEAGQSVRGGRAFRRGSCPDEKESASLPTPPAGPDRPPITAAQGGPKIKSQSARLVQRSCTSRCAGLWCGMREHAVSPFRISRDLL